MTLGIDLGTSGVKALLVDGDRPLASASAALTVQRPQPGWSEQDPAQWWEATCRCFDELRARHPHEFAAVRAIGLSGQMHGATLMDKADRVLRPCILWDDGRSAAECRALEAEVPELRQVTGNLAMPGFTAPKLRWVKAHEPELFARTAKVLLPKAWLRWTLSGEHVEEMSDASGTLWLDVARRQWSPRMLAACDLGLAHMPRLVEGTERAARVRPEWLQRFGFAQPVEIAGGAGDNAAGAVAVGAVKAGDAFVSLGTSGVLWATTARFAPAPERAVHAFCHALPGTWHQMGVMLAAASSLAWWARINGTDEATLLAELPEHPLAPAPCAFAPYLSGERTPHNDPVVRGGFVGLAADTTRAQMTQAVLEGVAYSFRDARDALAGAGTELREADLIGGGARSAYWGDVLASVLGLPLHRIEGGEHGCASGAARLARACVDGDLNFPKPPRLRTHEPLPALVERYDAAHARWQSLYPALRGLSSTRNATPPVDATP